MKSKRKLGILIILLVLIIISVIVMYMHNNRVNKIASVNETSKEAATEIVGKNDSRFKYKVNEDGRTITVTGTTFTYENNETNLIIPSTIDGYTVTKLDNIMIWGNPTNYSGGPKSITIPSTVIEITGYSWNPSYELENIYVDTNNQYFSSEDGVLFNKDKTKIIRYPDKRVGQTYEIPSTVTEIGKFAFYYCTNLIDIEIPQGVNTIRSDAFDSCRNLTTIKIPESVTQIESSVFFQCEKLTISCPEGSEAHKYAVKNSINFEILNSKHVISIGVAAGTQTEYIYGTQKLNGQLYLIVKYSDASIAVATNFDSPDITVTGFDSSKLGTQTITITYKGEASTTLDITLKERPLTAIEITSIPTKTSYTKDDKQIDLTGGKITLTYNDGTKEQKDMTAQGVTAKMIDTTTLGKKEVEITYNGKTAKFEVEVIQKIDYTDNNNGGAIITGEGEEENKEIIIPDKINGKPVTEIGDKAFANREDLISVKIPDSVTKIADNAFEGSPNVTIICNSGSKAEEFAKNKDMNYILENKTVESISIKTLPTKINYNKGEDLDITGGRILLTYTDKTTSPISMKFTGVTITGYDKTKLGEQQLRVTFKEKTTNFNVIVNTESTRKYGDVNGDGKVNAKDLLLLQGHILAEMPGGNTDRLLEGDNFTAGDMDSNGKINAKDLLLLQREILKNM